MPRRKIRYLTVSEAADFLHVSAATIRVWDRRKKLKAHRNRRNKYRLYLISKLQRFKETHLRKYNKTTR